VTDNTSHTAAADNTNRVKAQAGKNKIDREVQVGDKVQLKLQPYAVLYCQHAIS
jgi:hypothetical protein